MGGQSATAQETPLQTLKEPWLRMDGLDEYLVFIDQLLCVI